MLPRWQSSAAAAVSLDKHRDLLCSMPLTVGLRSTMEVSSLNTSVCMYHARQCIATLAVWKTAQCAWLSLLEINQRDMLALVFQSLCRVVLSKPCHTQLVSFHPENSRPQLCVHWELPNLWKLKQTVYFNC